MYNFKQSRRIALHYRLLYAFSWQRIFVDCSLVINSFTHHLLYHTSFPNHYSVAAAAAAVQDCIAIYGFSWQRIFVDCSLVINSCTHHLLYHTSFPYQYIAAAAAVQDFYFLKRLFDYLASRPLPTLSFSNHSIVTTCSLDHVRCGMNESINVMSLFQELSMHSCRPGG
jgi:hypothetical protein